MPTQILMPALSPTMTEGTLAKWTKNEGDAVKAGDVIAEIETDKAVMEVEAVDEGRIGKIVVPAGTAGVKVNEVIAILLEDGETVDSIQMSGDGRRVSGFSKVDSKSESTPDSQLPIPATRPPSTENRVFASPLAKRLAAQSGVNLANVKGSGPHGRIVKADVVDGRQVSGVGKSELPTDSRLPTPATRQPSTDTRRLVDAYGMEYTAVPNNMIKKVTAQRLLESKQTVPHFYLTVDFRIDALLEARAKINDEAKGAYKLSVNDFVVKACANALATYPAANVMWTDEAVLQFKHSDISVAVSTPNGLITPIVKKAQTKGLRQISDEVKQLAAKAKEGKLKPEEFQGGTFTISNLGMFGVRDFTAIINPPQACILAVGAGEERPYVENGLVKIGTFMTCTLSTDHRAVDGAIGAEFLQVLKRTIENPVLMLV
jgi:pyruvate dehydrogenase E2 component (dihydrolipoamide acetyltransferase)